MVALECFHFTVDVWWHWNVITSLWMCGDAGILSLHCGCVVALERYHFTVDVWWRWNVVTSLWMCGGSPSCSVNTLNPNTFTVRIRIAIGKCLHEFEYRPEVCEATNGSNTKLAWDMGYFSLYNGVSLFSYVYNFLNKQFLNLSYHS